MPAPSKFISSARRRRRPRWPLLIAGLVVLGAAAAGAVYLIWFQKEGDFSDPSAEFQSQPAPPPPPPKQKAETFKWPIYGYTPQRTRYLPVNMGPPARKLWRFTKGHGLIEFQPVLANGFLYYVNNSGQAFAVNAKTGKRRWSRKVGSLVASSPAWNKKRVYMVTLNPGSVICLNAKNGKKIWSKRLPSRSESSPIVVGGVVYFGSENGTVYAYRASNGAKVWTYHAGGAVKAGLAYSKGVLYFGAYGGSVTALRASNGSRVWSTGTSGASLNRSGNFYSTPAVAYGRVYLGNTDSFVYSFVAKSGRLAWRHATGSYVYAAPAVATAPRIGPAVFIGSYDGNFYALDAKSGGVRWSHQVGGRISGAPSVIGDIVYFSSLGNHDTSGLDVRSGRRVWHFKHGAFNPMVADGKRFYLTTNSTVFGLAPHASKQAKRKARAGKARSRRQAGSK
jgi:outer membrane protein assembly factor BamB